MPCAVKIVNGGSSIGVALPDTKEQLEKALRDLLRYGDHVVVEQKIKGREIQIAVLGDGYLPAVEIIPKGAYFDYESKYQAGGAVELCPAPITDAAWKQVGEMALKLHKGLGLSVYSRSDFILDEKGQAWCLEINTLPGMTPHQSGAPGGGAGGTELRRTVREDRGAVPGGAKGSAGMMPLTVQTICAAVGGTVLQSSGAAVRDVTTDSRRVPQEALFIPLVGERFDGHAYIEKALEAGAAGCLTAKTPEALLPGKFYIQVPDTRLALKALAAWYRGQFRLPVVQVTGSVGKTTTKEMIAAVLTQKYETLRTEGNLNNDIGAPLTLLRLMPEHEAAVIETGMNHFGEIRYLGEMVRPDIAVITNVGDAHIENLGGTRGRAFCRPSARYLTI